MSLNPIFGFNRTQIKGAVSRKQNSAHESKINSKEILPPTLKPMQPLSQAMAQSMRAVTFAGNRFNVANHVKLEARFIDDLKNEKNPDTRAAMAEMLGRTQSLQALPSLIDLLEKKENIQVRIASIRAIGDIGNSTHRDSYTRSQLGDILLDLYQSRKKDLNAGGNNAKFDLTKQVSSADEYKLRVEELKVIAETLGLLNIEAGRELLQNEFKSSFDIAENHTYRAQEMIRAIQMAEEEFVKNLEQQYKKSFQELSMEMHPKQLAEMKASIEIQLSDGSKYSINEAKAKIQELQKEHRVANEILGGLVNGLSQMSDTQTNAYLKLALDSSHPHIRAKALNVLGSRNEVNYAADIYPNLKHKNIEVRQAALGALLNSNETAAKQKLMELLVPDNFFALMGQADPLAALMGGAPGQDSDAFVQFLINLAINGDKYIGSLQKVAVDKDFDVRSRQMAMSVLQAMTQKPLSEELSQVAVVAAKEAIRSLAKQPTGNTPEEKQVIEIVATSLWISLKEHDAVGKAMKMLKDPVLRMSEQEQLAMLNAIFQSLQQDYDAVRQNNIVNLGRNLQDQLFNMLGRSVDDLKATLTPEQIQTLKDQRKPNTLDKMLNPASLSEEEADQFVKQLKQPVDTEFVQKVRANLDDISPVITKLLNHPTSTEARMLATRLAGVLGDKGNTDRLIEKLKNPLAGLVDWKQPRSYKGNPAQDSANIRVNTMVALGQIGDIKALDLIASALDDTTLKRYALPPLKELALSVTDKASDAQLESLRGKLLRLIANPDTTRLSRAVRIGAADTLFQYKGGLDDIRKFLSDANDPNFKRHVISALIANDYALDASHADHQLVKNLLYPGLGVEQLHAQGLTGKGIEMAIIDGGYVDKGQTEGFQNRVKLPPSAKDPEHTHPTMVMTTAAGNGKLKGVAPDAVVYSDKWPDLSGGPNAFDVYKKIIEGKLRGENNIKVINNSWGFSDNNVIVFKEVRDMLKQFKAVVDMAEKAGIQIVFSAGNEGEGMGVPGIGTLGLFGMDVDKLTGDEKKTLDYILDKIILVGASNTQGFDSDYSKHRLAEFSSIGDSLNNKLMPTIVAPGVDMMVYSWESGKRGKELVNGTSFSGPYVSGLITLLFQANPDLTPAQIRDILISTAVKLDGLTDTQQGYGSVHPQEAIKKAQSLMKATVTAPPVATLPPPKAEEIKPPPVAEEKPAAPVELPKVETPAAPVTQPGTEEPFNQVA